MLSVIILNYGWPRVPLPSACRALQGSQPLSLLLQPGSGLGIWLFSALQVSLTASQGGGDLEKTLTNFHTSWDTELAPPKASHPWRGQGWQSTPHPSPQLKGRPAQLPALFSLPKSTRTPRVWEPPIPCERNQTPSRRQGRIFPNLSGAGHKERTGKEECEWGLLVRGVSASLKNHRV